MDRQEEIKKTAEKIGFSLVGITDAGPIDSKQTSYFTRWLQMGYHGTMGYLQRNPDKRFCPASLLENARSIIVTGLNYKPPATAPQSDDQNGQIAPYARYRDYHETLTEKLNQLANWIKDHIADNLKFKICVDTAPLAERALAQKAGLGFLAKNHMLTNDQWGQQVFLGELITDLHLKSDKPYGVETCLCDRCDRCIKACPNDALKKDGTFDATRCINYLTIEYKGQISPDAASAVSHRIYGCEECITVCPYNRNAPVSDMADLDYHPQWAAIDPRAVLRMTHREFDRLFTGSAIHRVGLERLQRNARVCLNNITGTGVPDNT